MATSTNSNHFFTQGWLGPTGIHVRRQHGAVFENFHVMPTKWSISTRHQVRSRDANIMASLHHRIMPVAKTTFWHCATLPSLKAFVAIWQWSVVQLKGNTQINKQTGSEQNTNKLTVCRNIAGRCVCVHWERWAFSLFRRTPCPATPMGRADPWWSCHCFHYCCPLGDGPLAWLRCPGTDCNSMGEKYQLAAAVSKCCVTALCPDWLDLAVQRMLLVLSWHLASPIL